jgi:lia operon protein LiaG
VLGGDDPPWRTTLTEESKMIHPIHSISRGPAAAATVALGLLASVGAHVHPAGAQETHTLSGNHVAVYNLAGQVEVVGSEGAQVVVDVRRGGRDGGDLRVEVGSIGGRETLRVIYPEDRILYRDGRWSGNTTLRVQRDGTWGGGGGFLFGGGQRVRISNRGSGLEAHADLSVRVPRGQAIDIHLAVGRIRAENVDGQVRLDTHSGPVEAHGMSGSLVIDTGSGNVQVEGMGGDLVVDTGSGSVRAADVTADHVSIDTGSGSVVADDLMTERLVIDTGSGSVEVRRSVASDVLIDTGSGSVTAEIGGTIERLKVDTGSGNVHLWLPQDLSASLTIDTGSGSIDTDFPVTVTRSRRGRLEGKVGDGRGSVVVDTGSGSVRLRIL